MDDETQFTIEDMPEEIKQHVLSFGRVEWGSLDKRTDEDHVREFAETLRKTREHFGLEGMSSLEGVYLKGTEIVLCHTGTSPKAFLTAKILTALWNHFYDELKSKV